MKSKLILPALVVMATGAALLGGNFVHAQATTTDAGQHVSIIQRLVDRFGLKEADVKAVFDEERTARQAEMKAKEEERLNQLVTDGKITEAQKQLIIAKRAEMETNQEAMPMKDTSLTPAERKANMEARKTELDNWAKANGIDVQYLMGGFGGRGHGGFGMPDGMPMMSGVRPTTTS
jgi:cytochrome c1